MLVARWRWLLIPMVGVVAGCLPQSPPELPASFLEAFGVRGLSFTMSEPPLDTTAPVVLLDRFRLGPDAPKSASRQPLLAATNGQLVVRPTAILRRAQAVSRLGHRLPRRGATIGRLGRVGRAQWRLLPVGWTMIDTDDDRDAAWNALHDAHQHGGPVPLIMSPEWASTVSHAGHPPAAGPSAKPMYQMVIGCPGRANPLFAQFLDGSTQLTVP